MDDIGGFTPDQAQKLWQDYLSRKQLKPHVSQNYTINRTIYEPQTHRVYVKNTSGETCPAFGCMKVTGVEIVGGVTTVTIDKPDTISGEFLINSQFQILDTECGWAYRYGVVVALGNGVSPTAANVRYQPVVGEWTIEESAGGFFTVFGEHNVQTDAVIGRFAGGGGNIVHGIVGAEDTCNPGYYTVQLATWTGTHVEITTPCPATYTVTGSGTTACAISLIEPPVQVTGTGVYVKAYSCAATSIPLKSGAHCLLTNLGDTVITGVAPNFVTVPVWQIVEGRLHEEVYYEEEWECCDGAGETGVETLISRTPSIVAAIRLPSITCGSCTP